MSSGSGAISVDQVNPTEAWEELKKNPNAKLVDVRTQAEWGFVGVPDLSELGKDVIFVEWAQYPGMSRNPRFVEAVLAQAGEDPGELYFICRSGVRSDHAANAVAASLAAQGVAARCVNVAEGFEGDPNADGHRSSHNGWKLRGLPWRQS